jgi:hypothetical protein
MFKRRKKNKETFGNTVPDDIYFGGNSSCFFRSVEAGMYSGVRRKVNMQPYRFPLKQGEYSEV